MPPRKSKSKGKEPALESSPKPRQQGEVARQRELTQYAVIDTDIGFTANLFDLIDKPWQDRLSAPGLVVEEDATSDIIEGMLEMENNTSEQFDKQYVDTTYRSHNIEYDSELVEDAFQDFQTEAYNAMGIGKEKRPKTRKSRAEMPLSSEVRALLGQANEHYVHLRMDEAIQCLQQVIQIDANIHQGWNTLGLIYSDVGDEKKAVQAYFMAANLQPKNTELWKKVAQMSYDLGDRKQQLYCISQALKATPEDLDLLWDRAMIYKEMKYYKRSKDGFKQLLKEIPYDMNIRKELAEIYIEQKEISDAITLYESAFNHYKRTIPMNLEGSFGYSELLFLANLYMKDRRYHAAIDSLRKGIRWLQGRGMNSEWDKFQDDREFDLENEREFNVNNVGQRNSKIPRDQNRGDIPIDFRVKFGICRLRLNQLDEAKRHFNIVFEHNKEQGWDLLDEIGHAYFELRLWQDALNVFLRIYEYGTNADLLRNMGYCHKHLSKNNEAIECFLQVINENPDDLTSKIALAELYEDNEEEEKAMAIVREIIRTQESSLGLSNRKHGRFNISDDSLLVGSQIEAVKRSLVADEKSKQRRSSTGLRKAQWNAELEQMKEEETRLIFNSVKNLKERVIAGDEEATKEYLKEAATLVEDFMSLPALFPNDRKKEYTGIRQYVQRNESLDVQVEEMADRLQRTLENQSQDVKVHGQGAQYLRTIFIEDWLDALYVYSWAMAKQDKQGSYQAVKFLNNLAESTVVYNHPNRSNTLRLVLIACAAFQGNVYEVANGIRWFQKTYQFRSSGHQLFGVMLSQGQKQQEEFHNGRHQKYISRQYREMETLLGSTKGNDKLQNFTNIPSSSASEESDGEDDISNRVISKTSSDFIPSKKNVDNYVPDRWNVHVSLLYGHQATTAKSHPLALGHYFKSFSHAPRDPLINLCVGSAYLHRAMMRTTDNRHFQILQGFTFLFRYFEIRNKNQESHYNLARAFHQLSLYHIAVPYYEKVLDMSEAGGISEEEDLVREAAYNLYVIYVSHGNNRAAATYAEKHLCI